MKLYDKIGQNYNRTRKADQYITNRLNDLLGKSQMTKSVFLDVGCGTGNYTIKLLGEGNEFFAVDPSSEMLNRASSNSTGVNWIKASVEELPFDDLMFDGVLAVLTIHHWDDLVKGFEEIYRVMKPFSKFVVFTSTQEQMSSYWLNYYFPKIMNYSISKMPSRKVILNAAKRSNMVLVIEEPYFVREDLEDLFLYSGKNRPALYFSSEIRSGISSFANSTEFEEIEQGLDRLKEDLTNKKIMQVVDNYDNSRGDYCFLVFEKEN